MRLTPTPSTRGLVVLAIALSTLACGDATGVDPEDLAGTWRASSAIATNAADPSETVDVVAIGFSITFVIDGLGGVESIIEFQGDIDRDFGTLTVVDSEFTLFLDGSESTGTISRRDDTLTINVITGVAWDFGDDGIDDPSTFLLTMLRST